MKKKSLLIMTIFLCLVLSIFAGCGSDSTSPGNPTPTPTSVSNPTPTPSSTPGSTPTPSPTPGTIKIALYTDSGASSTYYTPEKTILINAGFIVTEVSAANIKVVGGLSNYDVVIFPGGSGGTTQATALGETDGCVEVKRFVNGGGGYVGTCAGAYLAAKGYNTATGWLELVNAVALGAPNDSSRGKEELSVTITDSSHPIVQGFSGTIVGRYENGPVFSIGTDTNLDYHEVGTYTSDFWGPDAIGTYPGTMANKGALVTANYGSGRCVLFSFHPELSNSAKYPDCTVDLAPMLVHAVQWVAKRL